jgi:hypothetical protein
MNEKMNKKKRKMKAHVASNWHEIILRYLLFCITFNESVCGKKQASKKKYSIIN